MSSSNFVCLTQPLIDVQIRAGTASSEIQVVITHLATLALTSECPYEKTEAIQGQLHKIDFFYLMEHAKGR